MKILKIAIKRDDFLHSSGYISNHNCPLARALRNKFPNKEISVGGMTVKINDNLYKIDRDEFNESFVGENILLAKKLKRNSIIITLILNKF